jgi:hypothetical protein
MSDETENVQGNTEVPAPEVPVIDSPPVTRDDVLAIGRMFAEFRSQIADMQAEIKKNAPRVFHNAVDDLQTAEDRLAARLEEISKHDFYCPGCGKLVDYLQACIGSPTAPHPPIEVVSTDELKGDESGHTPAPNTGD